MLFLYLRAQEVTAASLSQNDSDMQSEDQRATIQVNRKGAQGKARSKSRR